MNEMTLAPIARRRRGSGTLRERRPGVFEMRIPVGIDPVTQRTRQASHSVHGTRAEAEAMLDRLVAQASQDSSVPGPLVRLDKLLAHWIEADHPWKPSTLVGYRSVARFLTADPIGRCRAQQLMPADGRAAMQRCRRAGASDPVVAGRFRTLHAALGWAYSERIIDQHPLRSMRGPARATPRRPLSDDAVLILLATVETAVLEAIANDTDHRRGALHRHRCELDLLLARLAADGGARRGELAALRLGDLRGRVLHISRADSAGQPDHTQVGPWAHADPGRRHSPAVAHPCRRMERPSRTADRPVALLRGPRPSPSPRRPTLGHRFTRLRETAGIPDATLHRLRHSVATFLVARGEILHAQARLGHADAATTLREYAYALPLTHGSVADALDRHLEQRPYHAETTQPQD